MHYVVLHHTGHGDPHHDLMLATDDTSPLLTWRLTAWPPRPADAPTPLPAHRRDYLTYEGPVSNNRGEVKRVAEGEFEILETTATSLRVRFADHHLVLDLPRASPG